MTPEQIQKNLAILERLLYLACPQQLIPSWKNIPAASHGLYGRSSALPCPMRASGTQRRYCTLIIALADRNAILQKKCSVSLAFEPKVRFVDHSISVR